MSNALEDFSKAIDATPWTALAATRDMRARILAGKQIDRYHWVVQTPAHGVEEWWITSVNGSRFTVQMGSRAEWTGPVRLSKRSEASRARATEIRKMQRDLVRSGLPPCSWRTPGAKA